MYVPIGLGKSQDRNGRVLGNRREVGQIRLLLWQWRCAGVNITLKYRWCRWQVELFFKWIKQHLRIKRFYGTSENAVRTQIWIAISVYVLVAIIKKKLRLNVSLHTLLQILSLTLFEKLPLKQAVAGVEPIETNPAFYRQLNLFEF